MRSGDATFPGYWIGILRKPSRVRGVELPLRHSQRCSLRLPSIQEQLDPCSSFPVSFLLMRMRLFHFLCSWINLYLSTWTGVLVFFRAWYHTIPVHLLLFLLTKENSFLFCYPTQTQNAGSTYIMHRNAENRLGQWPQSYAVTFVPLSTLMPFLWGDCLCI